MSSFGLQTLPLLVAAAAVAPRKQPERRRQMRQEKSAMYAYMKNTFIAFCEDRDCAEDSRRSSSEPPVRSCSSSCKPFLRIPLFDDKAAVAARTSSEDDDSTEDGNDSDAASSDDRSAASSSSAASPLRAEAQALCLADLVPERSSSSRRSSLKSNAKAWSPQAAPTSAPSEMPAMLPPVAAPPQMQPHVQQQFEAIMAVGQAALRDTLQADSKTEDNVGWAVEGSFKPTTWEHAMLALETVLQHVYRRQQYRAVRADTLQLRLHGAHRHSGGRGERLLGLLEQGLLLPRACLPLAAPYAAGDPGGVAEAPDAARQRCCGGLCSRDHSAGAAMTSSCRGEQAG
eukprot:TRINITY_DN3100_c0_g1_i3.p1 TRINITY_DN3100_c0_g1~~TRINITY_DN3100_c0_g1_i3.p1  ORF type:complete len:343 (-),score=91.25 TRINITY_DN3100_c0_g1_i3:147-1175(-)